MIQHEIGLALLIFKHDNRVYICDIKYMMIPYYIGVVDFEA